MTITLIDIVLVLLPSIIGYGSQFLCNIGKNSGEKVLFRPPSWVFRVIWPILFLLFGISWAIAARNCDNKYLCIITYCMTALLLGLWIIVYSNKCGNSKKGASWVLLLVIVTELASFSQGNSVSKLLISPLIAWSLFALIMNTTEVQIGNTGK